MATIQKSDVIGAITVYLLNENRPCPAHYLTEKFGDDVGDVIASLKKDGVIIGKRGRGGGIVFPDTVFEKKEKSTTKKIEATPIQTIADIANDILADSEPMIMQNDANSMVEDNDMMDLEEAPF